jgi:hypothetical protein
LLAKALSYCSLLYWLGRIVQSTRWIPVWRARESTLAKPGWHWSLDLLHSAKVCLGCEVLLFAHFAFLRLYFMFYFFLLLLFFFLIYCFFVTF